MAKRRSTTAAASGGRGTQRRRSNGSGSVWWSEERNRYVGQISVYDDDGKLRRRTVVGATQREVEERLELLRSSADVSATLPASPTVSRFLTYWLDEVLPTSGVRAKTIEGYANCARLYLDPVVGRLELRALTVADVRRVRARLVDRGLSANTQRLAHTTLSAALSVAVTEGLLDSNPARTLGGVRKVRTVKERRSLSPEQASAVLATADLVGERPLVLVLLGLGLRRSEALGLRWRDVDLDGDRPRLTVVGALTKNERGVHAWERGGKSTSAQRTVLLPAEVAAVLRRHRAAQAELRLAAGDLWARGWQFEDMVFTTSSGRPRDLDRATRTVAEITTAATGERWTPHDLRHSCASLLLASGVPLKMIQELLGHSSISVTADIYAHVLDPLRDDARDAMDRLLVR